MVSHVFGRRFIITSLVMCICLGVIGGSLRFGQFQSTVSASSEPPDSYLLSISANERVNSNTEFGSLEVDLHGFGMDATGNSYFIYKDNREGNFNLYFATCPVSQPCQPSEVLTHSTQSTDAFSGALAVASDGTAYVAITYNNSLTVRSRSVTGIWSAPVEVRDTANNFCGNPDIALDAAGNLAVIWLDYRNYALYEADIYFAYRPAGGDWGANERVNDDTTAYHQDDPSLALDAAGNVYAVWADHRRDANGVDDLYFSYRPAEDVWGANELIDNPAPIKDRKYPDLAVDASGNAGIIWEDFRNNSTYSSDIYFTTRSSAGVWGGIPIRISNDLVLNGEYQPSLVSDGAGNLFAAWQSGGDGASHIWFASRPLAGAWSAKLPIESPSIDNPNLYQYGAILALDGGGNISVAFLDGRFGLGVVFSSRNVTLSNAVAGTWAAAELISDGTGGASQMEPALALNPLGGVVAAWHEWRTSWEKLDLYASLRSSPATWSIEERANEFLVTGDQQYPRLAIDASGTQYVIWSHNDGLNIPDIRFALRPNGGDWQPDETISQAGEAFEQPDLVVDDAGNAHAVWLGSWPSYVYYAYRPTGGIWGIPERVDDGPDAIYRFHPRIGISELGDIYIIYSQVNGVYTDVRFVYRLGDGWSGSDIIVADDPTDPVYPSNQSEPDLAVDAEGNAYAVWWDTRFDKSDVYFAYRLEGGSWSEGYCIHEDARAGRQTSPSIAVDPEGNLFATWHEALDGVDGSNIFVAFQPAGGQWGSAMKVNDDLNQVEHIYPEIVALDEKRAALVWEDYRSGFNADVYYAEVQAIPLFKVFLPMIMRDTP